MPDPHPPIVSVIMSMRDSSATVADAVKSILLQTLREWELIVIDDGSLDDCAAIVDGFGDPRIRLVRETASAGLARRLNQAVALCRGEFIARMDADDISLPDRLARQLAAMRADPALDVLASRAVVFNDAMELIGLLPGESGHDAIVARPYDGIPLPHPTWFGRAAWFRANPYDPAMLKAEDQDLLLRTHRRSRFGALDEVLLAYRQSRLDFNKLLSGRRAYMGALWREGGRSGRRVEAVLGIATHFAKAVVDGVTLAVGLNGAMQRGRLRPVPPSVAGRWHEVVHALRSLPALEPA